MTNSKISTRTYVETAIPHLQKAVEKNKEVLDLLAKQLVSDVKAGKALFVFGSGHSSIFPFELYHRAGGASFVIPVFADYLLPTAGPTVVRLLERTPGAATPLLNRVSPQKGEMIWLCSQSGINAAIVDLALECKSRGMRTVAFTSLAHSQAVKSRHGSGKRLFEICDHTVDFCGVVGDAAIEVSPGVFSGPLSTLSAVTLGHSIILAAVSELESSGHRCVYTSVNTPEGETRNLELEKSAALRDYLLR